MLGRRVVAYASAFSATPLPGSGPPWAPHGMMPTAGWLLGEPNTHLVLQCFRVQQLKLALQKLVVAVQWMWHFLYLHLLLWGCLQGLGQLDVRQHLG